MESLNVIYEDEFFKKRLLTTSHIPIVCEAILEVFQPQSIIDIGCAIGQFIGEFQARGIEAAGIEGSTNALPYINPSIKVFIHDLRKPWPYVKRYGLALSFEVAEHIEPEYTAEYLNTLCLLSDRILITAALPGQKGKFHVNCQSIDYWIQCFKNKGYLHKPEYEDKIKRHWVPWANTKAMELYYRNLLYFEREK